MSALFSIPRSLRGRLFLLVLIPAIVAGAHIANILISGNFQPITEGEAYRSGQLNEASLERHLREYRIKSVLNLRGKNSGKDWYETEIAACKRLSVLHYDLTMSSSGKPNPDAVSRLMTIFREAPRPILIHCRNGSDRSGLVAALWKMVVDGEPKAIAQKQLSFRYGHFPIGQTSVLDDFFNEWEPAAVSPSNSR